MDGTASNRLTTDSLLAAAFAETGLNDLGDNSLSVREGLEQYVSSLKTDLDLDETASAGVASEIKALLANAFRIVDDRKRNPGIAKERIERPIIIAGLGRSGTTLIQELLAAHPRNRTPHWWESSFPSPPPGNATPDDPRRAMGDEIIRRMVESAPGVLISHPYLDAGGNASVECETFMMMSFRSSFFFAPRSLPSYLAWYWQADQVPAYQFHREFLQHLQWGAEPRRWVLKGTRHTYNLDALRAVYPDAVVLWMHRDPVEQYASSLALSNVVRPAKDAEQRHLFATQRLDEIETGLGRALASPVFDDDSYLCHLRFEHLVADPVGTIRNVYERHGLDYSSDFESAMRGWLADPANRSDRYGKLRYNLTEFGINREDAEKRFAFYRERLNHICPL